MATIIVPIEVDVTYVNKIWNRVGKQQKEEDRHYVIGFFVRSDPGNAVIKAMPDNKPETISRFVTETVSEGAFLYSEAGVLPGSLRGKYEIIELQVGKHSNGDIHVNNVNNMWKDLKRQIKREHIQVSQKHLQSYCDEVAWRINNRHLTAMEKFNFLLANSVVKDRKTSYKNLIK